MTYLNSTNEMYKNNIDEKQKIIEDKTLEI